MALRLIVNHKKLEKSNDKEIIDMICHAANGFKSKTVDNEMMFFAIKTILPDFTQNDFIRVMIIMNLFGFIEPTSEKEFKLREPGLEIARKLEESIKSIKN